MMIVTRYRPAYFTGFPDEQVTVGTLADLMTVPWVAQWTEISTFHRFSVGDYYGKGLLMCELDEGQTWWVVAILDSTDNLGLPRWQPIPTKEGEKDG